MFNSSDKILSWTESDPHRNASIILKFMPYDWLLFKCAHHINIAEVFLYYINIRKSKIFYTYTSIQNPCQTLFFCQNFWIVFNAISSVNDECFHFYCVSNSFRLFFSIFVMVCYIDSGIRQVCLLRDFNKNIHIVPQHGTWEVLQFNGGNNYSRSWIP